MQSRHASGSLFTSLFASLSAVAPIAVCALAIAGVLAPVSGQAPPDSSDFGEVSFANSGPQDAQSPFLRGLGALHDFEWDAAAENFRTAQKTAPGFAMAYWGEAMTYNDGIHFRQNADAARAALARLAPTLEGRLAKCGTERERDYMRAIELLYNGPGTKEERDFQYADAMATLHAKYPDDVDAAALYALSLMSTAHTGRDFSVFMRSLAVLQPLFFAHPNHPGVVHYLIHSVDDPIHAPLGLLAARNYSKVALKAPHAQHMTSHIFVAMGLWDDVVQANLIASRVLNQQNAAKHRAPTVCGHYDLWLQYGRLQQGRLRDAKQVLDACRAAADASLNGGAVEMPEMPGMATSRPMAAYAQMRLRYLLDSGDWTGEVARWPMPPGADPGARLTFTFADGYGAAKRGDLASARHALATLSSEPTVGARGVGTGAATAADYAARARILQQELRALIAAAEGKRDEAIALLSQAVDAERAMPYEYGPPFVDKPTQELLGEMLLEAEQPLQARKAFQQALVRTPQRTQALAGLWRAAQAAGDGATAQDAARRLRAIWHGADALPEDLDRAR